MTPIFTLHIEITDEPARTIGYTSIGNCFRDAGLKALFDAGRIQSCAIYCKNQRLASLPRMTWEYLTDRLISNAATLLRASLEQLDRNR